MGPASDPPDALFEPASLRAWIDELLTRLEPPAAGLCIAFSGGLDSTVLLHALGRLRGAASWPPLRALHVDHGLQDDSPAWARRCIEMAADAGIACRVLTVDARPPRGASPEAWARRTRLAALAAELTPGEVLLTAHQADDQLETVLLQLLRGGGPAGLAGMPRIARFARGWLARPLLAVTRSSIAHWARQQSLAWIEDPSNLDPRFDRNYLRHVVLPAVRARWPLAALTAVETAGLTAEALELASLAAQADLATAREGLTLPLAALEGWSHARQSAVLRAWIADAGLPLPSSRTLAALRRDLWRAAADRVPCARWQDARIYRYRGRLYADRARLPADRAPRRWQAQRGIALEGGERLELCPVVGRGLSRVRLPPELELRARRGGELFRPASDTHTRPLRKWLQERGVLPWLRDRVPLVFAGDTLICVGDLGYGSEYAARPGEDACEIRWRGRPVLTETEALRTSPLRDQRATRDPDLD